jgi:hypothetical protein
MAVSASDIPFLANFFRRKGGASGEGDVAGPASSVNLRVAVFSGTTGKLLADGGKGVADLAPAWVAVTQSSHGFAALDLVRHNGTAWVKAQANSLAGATGVRAVVEVVDANTFRHAALGSLSGLTLDAATQYYLSPTTAGLFTSVAPTTVGHVILPLFVTSTTALAELNIGDPVEIVAAEKPVECLLFALSDETTALTTGTAKVTVRMPYAFTLTGVRASVTTAPTDAALIVDINEGGSTILSTKLSIDAGEKTSTTAASAAVISDTALADDAELTFDIDQVGSTVAGAGLKVTLIGTRA